MRAHRAAAGGVQLTITDVLEPLAAPPALSAAAAAARRIQAHPKAQDGVARKAAKDAKQAELAARQAEKDERARRQAEERAQLIRQVDARAAQLQRERDALRAELAADEFAPRDRYAPPPDTSDLPTGTGSTLEREVRQLRKARWLSWRLGYAWRGSDDDPHPQGWGGRVQLHRRRSCLGRECACTPVAAHLAVASGRAPGGVEESHERRPTAGDRPRSAWADSRTGLAAAEPGGGAQALGAGTLPSGHALERGHARGALNDGDVPGERDA